MKPLGPDGSPETIVRAVAAAYIVEPDEIVGRSRNGHLSEARCEAAYRLWRETDLCLWEIGCVLGDRDHSTIHYLIRRHELRMGRR